MCKIEYKSPCWFHFPQRTTVRSSLYRFFSSQNVIYLIFRHNENRQVKNLLMMLSHYTTILLSIILFFFSRAVFLFLCVLAYIYCCTVAYISHYKCFSSHLSEPVWYVWWCLGKLFFCCLFFLFIKAVTNTFMLMLCLNILFEPLKYKK